MTRIRVLHLVPHLGHGGAERVAARVAAGLPRERFEPTVVSLRAPTAHDVVAELAARSVPVLDLGKRPGPDPRMPWRLRALLDRLRPDVLHTHLRAAAYALPAVLWRPPPAVVHTVHNVAEHEGGLLLRLALRLAYRGSVRPVAVADAVAASVRVHYGLPRCDAVRNGVAPRPAVGGVARAAWRAAAGLAEGDVVAAVVGRLEPQKGHGVLFAALAAVAPALPCLRVLLAGAGPLEDDLRRRASALGLERHVRFLGFRSDVADLLRASDLFVLPSLWEGCPLALLEAQAAGLAVAAAAVGGVPELVEDGVTGLLAPPGDPTALGAALRRLVADEGLRRALGSRAETWARSEATEAAMVDGYARLYDEFLRGARP